MRFLGENSDRGTCLSERACDGVARGPGRCAQKKCAQQQLKAIECQVGEACGFDALLLATEGAKQGNGVLQRWVSGRQDRTAGTTPAAVMVSSSQQHQAAQAAQHCNLRLLDTNASEIMQPNTAAAHLRGLLFFARGQTLKTRCYSRCVRTRLRRLSRAWSTSAPNRSSQSWMICAKRPCSETSRVHRVVSRRAPADEKIYCFPKACPGDKKSQASASKFCWLQ